LNPEPGTDQLRFKKGVWCFAFGADAKHR